MSFEIPKIGDLFEKPLNGEVIDQKVSRLTAPGENYGSLILKVDVSVRNKNKEEVIHAVAKCVPPNKNIQEIFNTPVTFVTEIGWYQQAIPTIIEFQKECGLKHVADYFMKSYGARYSLDPIKNNNQEVDEHGVLLLENLITQGYVNVDRRVGFNLIQSTEIIKKLASFHATTLAIKLNKPELFKNKIKKFIPAPKTDFEGGPGLEILDKTLETFKEIPELSPYVPKILQLLKDFSPFKQVPPREPWATAAHSDFWVNNIMLKDQGKDKPPKVIILDLQICRYLSPVSDLIFFLGVSVQTSIAEKVFDELIELYYKEFIENLKALKTDITPFSRKSFEEELKSSSNFELTHLLFFVSIVLAVKGSVEDVTNTDFDPKVGMTKMFENMTPEHKAKYIYIIKQFIKRNWL